MFPLTNNIFLSRETTTWISPFHTNNKQYNWVKQLKQKKHTNFIWISAKVKWQIISQWREKSYKGRSPIPDTVNRLDRDGIHCLIMEIWQFWNLYSSKIPLWRTQCSFFWLPRYLLVPIRPLTILGYSLWLRLQYIGCHRFRPFSSCPVQSIKSHTSKRIGEYSTVRTCWFWRWWVHFFCCNPYTSRPQKNCSK